jgi:hypothetical protein
MDVELPSDEAILEAMIMDLRPPLELEALLVGYQQTLGLSLEMGSTWSTTMHKPQGCAVLCTYCIFRVSVFKFCIP